MTKYEKQLAVGGGTERAVQAHSATRSELYRRERWQRPKCPSPPQPGQLTTSMGMGVGCWVWGAAGW